MERNSSQGGTPLRAPARRPHRVAALTFPGGQILDVTGPLEVFARAERWLRDEGRAGAPVYEVEVLAPAAGPVAMSSGVELVARRAFADACAIDTLLVCGGVGTDAALRDRALVAWLQRQEACVPRMASVCTGAFLLAEAGLLDGRRATTHWAWCDRLARDYPRVEVVPDAIFVAAEAPRTSLYTSAGVTAGIDLALALVEEDWGRDVALAVARELVVFLKRPGGQSQFSRHLAALGPAPRPIQELELWVLENLGADLSVEALAGRVHMSPRNFARIFRRETGTTPAKFVELARVEEARRRLEESSLGTAAIATACGFGTHESMRRTFLRHLGVGPAEYRRRFQRSALGDPLPPALRDRAADGRRPVATRVVSSSGRRDARASARAVRGPAPGLA
jgi:transcriptional regulator GlxA family with amidase domain